MGLSSDTSQKLLCFVCEVNACEVLLPWCAGKVVLSKHSLPSHSFAAKGLLDVYN